LANPGLSSGLTVTEYNFSKNNLTFNYHKVFDTPPKARLTQKELELRQVPI